MKKHTVTIEELDQWKSFMLGEMRTFASSRTETSNKTLQTNYDGTWYVVMQFDHAVAYAGDNAEKAIEIYNELP